MRNMLSFLCGLLIAATAFAQGLTQADAVAKARPKAEKALTAAYAKFVKKLKQTAPDSQPAVHEGSWTEKAGEPTIVEVKDGFEVHWAHPAPAGWDYDVRVAVKHGGAVHVLAAEASWANH